MMIKTWKSTWKVHGGSWNHTQPSMQCMSAFLGGCPALMLRVASQWATPADLEIFSQIGICLLFASEYHCLHLCITLIPGEYRINCITLLIHLIFGNPFNTDRSSAIVHPNSECTISTTRPSTKKYKFCNQRENPRFDRRRALVIDWIVEWVN